MSLRYIHPLFMMPLRTGWTRSCEFVHRDCVDDMNRIQIAQLYFTGMDGAGKKMLQARYSIWV